MSASEYDEALSEVNLPNPLPSLREDLKLYPASPNGDGSTAWVIQDPVSNIFYRIGLLEFELLSRWHRADPAKVLVSTDKETPLSPTAHELSEVFSFLLENQLLSLHTHHYTRYLLDRFRVLNPSKIKLILRNYLFFRVPLVRPNAFLQQLLPWVEWLYSPVSILIIVSLSLLGIFFTSQQWDLFTAGFAASFTPAGIVGFLLALILTKCLHELGHALTATRYGVRVTHMGVAFLVLFPMLYTDTGESWKLADRRQRLAIASSGILFECGLAGLATLAWSLTSDADLRAILFFLSTTAWFLSLVLNASPFLRFDGYFILSDLLDLPNLHERSFALARTALRNTLFGFGDRYPEDFTNSRRRGLIVFAYCTWLYRLIVFVGIAIAVYTFFFKLLGIFLFAVEIGWFVLNPIKNEMSVWHARRTEIKMNRKIIAIFIAGLLAILACIPVKRTISAPGWVHPVRSYVFYSPMPAKLVGKPAAEGQVSEGALLFSLQKPEHEFGSQVALASAGAIEQQLKGLVGVAKGEELRTRLETTLELHERQASSQREEAERLNLHAPFTGMLMDINNELRSGIWVTPREPLATLIDPTAWLAEVFVAQDRIHLLSEGSAVTFYPEHDRLNPIKGMVVDIDTSRIKTLPHQMLASSYGGQIPVLRAATDLSPRDTLYRVKIQLLSSPNDTRVLRGNGVIKGTSDRLISRIFNPVITLFVRELSF